MANKKILVKSLVKRLYLREDEYKNGLVPDEYY